MSEETYARYDLTSDLDEQFLYDHYPKVFEKLLVDHTTGGNIIWATDDYKSISNKHDSHAQITVESITGEYSGIIKPRIIKSREVKLSRTKRKAEVFTPAWVCNAQNSLIDDAWFGRKDVFNMHDHNGWKTNRNKIEFTRNSRGNWKNYVDGNRLEITCGEAPYIVSRYDATTGSIIPLEDRIGFLDRKIRIVTENTHSESEWLMWFERSFQASYGFEFQGDSLLIARENVLATYIDYMQAKLNRNPSEKELENIADIISWNLWQMDGLTSYPPYADCNEQEQLSLFDDLNSVETNKSQPCKIKDWRANEVVTFLSLYKKVKDW